MPDLTIKNEDTHTTPGTGYTKFYIKGDKNPYIKDDTGTETLIATGSGSNDFHTGYIYGLRMARTSNNAVTIGSGSCRDYNDTFNMVNAATRTANITNSGAGGLDTGTESSDTWYALHLIDDSSGNNTEKAMLSLSATAPTMPAGYDKFRRVGWVRNDGSSNFMEFIQTGEGYNRRIVYDEEFGNLEVLNSGSATSYTSVDLSDFTPSTSRRPLLSIAFDQQADGNLLYLRPTGSTKSDAGWWYGHGESKNDTGYAQMEMVSSSSQSIDYKVEGGGDDAFIYVVGYFDEL